MAAHKKATTRRIALTSVQRSYIAALGALSWNFDAACRAKRIPLDTVNCWLQLPAFQEEIDRRQSILSAAANVTAVEVIGTLADQLRADIADILPDEPIVLAARKAGVSHLIQSIKVNEKVSRKRGSQDEEILERHVEVKLYDAQKAAVTLGKWLGIEARDDVIERTRIVIRAMMDLEGLSAEEAIIRITPHFPAAPRLRDEFMGAPLGPVINQNAIT